MGDPNILFGFDDPSEKDKAVKSTQHWFSCLGASVSCRSTFRRRPSERRGRRTAEVNLTVTDSQTGTPRAASSSGTDRSPLGSLLAFQDGGAPAAHCIIRRERLRQNTIGRFASGLPSVFVTASPRTVKATVG